MGRELHRYQIWKAPGSRTTIVNNAVQPGPFDQVR